MARLQSLASSSPAATWTCLLSRFEPPPVELLPEKPCKNPSRCPRISGYPHPPGILQKSPQTIENKGNECKKERQERKRVRKCLKRMDLRWEGRSGPKTKPV